MSLTESKIDNIRYFLAENPRAGRYSVMEQFDLRESEARRAIDIIRNEPDQHANTITWCVFDIECTDLKGDIGYLLCCSIYSSIDGMKTFRQDEILTKKHMADDHTLAVMIRDELERHHIVCSYFGKGFDVPFLTARLIKHGERVMEPRLHFDAIWAYRGWRGPKLRSSRMAVVAEHLGLREQKQHVDGADWALAAAGDPDAFDTMVERCESDVRVTCDLVKHALNNRLLKNIQSYP